MNEPNRFTAKYGILVHVNVLYITRTATQLTLAPTVVTRSRYVSHVVVFDAHGRTTLYFFSTTLSHVLGEHLVFSIMGRA